MHYSAESAVIYRQKKGRTVMGKNNSASDMLTGSLWNKLLLFAFPAAAITVLEQLSNVSDIAVAGNFTGADKRSP